MVAAAGNNLGENNCTTSLGTPGLGATPGETERGGITRGGAEIWGVDAGNESRRTAAGDKCCAGNAGGAGGAGELGNPDEIWLCKPACAEFWRGERGDSGDCTG